MAQDKVKADPQAQPADEQDVEGHMMINPTIASDMARARSKDLDRAVRERNRSKEAKR
jgi:hypothetical protein